MLLLQTFSQSTGKLSSSNNACRSRSGTGAGLQDYRNPRQSASGSTQYQSARSSRHTHLPSAADPPHTTCVIRAGHHGAWRLGGLCVFVRLKKSGRLYMRGRSISPSCSFRYGGSPLYDACRIRGSSAGQTRRRRCHWMTHRSSSVRLRFVYVCWLSLNDCWTDARSWRFLCRVMAATVKLVVDIAPVSPDPRPCWCSVSHDNNDKLDLGGTQLP